MHCPYCQLPLAADAPECPACRLSYPRATTLLGVRPRFHPLVADTTYRLRPSEINRLTKRIRKLHKRFPQLVMQIVMHESPREHPFALHAFWLFNAGAFAGETRRGRHNHALMLLIDPRRGESALVPGYALEGRMPAKEQSALLELAALPWSQERWAEGAMEVLNGLETLLEGISQTETGEMPAEF